MSIVHSFQTNIGCGHSDRVPGWTSRGVETDFLAPSVPDSKTTNTTPAFRHWHVQCGPLPPEPSPPPVELHQRHPATVIATSAQFHFVLWAHSMTVRIPTTIRRAGMTAVVGVCLCAAGCVDMRRVRTPNIYASFPAAENRAFQSTDPFPDPDIGPSTDARPRGYERPRSSARKAAELRVLQGLRMTPEAVPAGVPSGASRYPRAVNWIAVVGKPGRPLQQRQSASGGRQ